MTYINRADLTRYVENTLPNEDLSDFDFDAIVDDLLKVDPDLIGEPQPYQTDEPQALSPTVAYLDYRITAMIGEQRYWEIVAAHDINEGVQP